jgi:hypothetical protein
LRPCRSPSLSNDGAIARGRRRYAGGPGLQPAMTAGVGRWMEVGRPLSLTLSPRSWGEGTKISPRPSLPPLAPFRGEGAGVRGCTLTHSFSPTPPPSLPPLAPFRGEGAGVRGCTLTHSFSPTPLHRFLPPSRREREAFHRRAFRGRVPLTTVVRAARCSWLQSGALDGAGRR